MNNSGQILLYSLLLLISLALGSWFYNNFSWVNEEKEVGFQGIAKTNKLLASEFFLRKMGVSVQQVNGLVAFRDLPSSRHTLLIATQRDTLNKDLSEKLLHWVRSGGHLIVEARYLETADINKDNNKTAIDDYLLEELRVFSHDTNISEIARKNAIEAEKSKLKDNCECKEDIPVVFSVKNTDMNINFPYDLTLQNDNSEKQALWLMKDDTAQYLMQFSLQRGLLTVLTSTSMFNNKHIAQYDHARFLHYLVQQQGHDAGVWLIRVDDMPPLWQWLWTNAWPVMFSLSLLFVFWLWRAPLRFGPLLNDEQTQRRSLLEHIQASGYYRWHNNQSGYLLAKVQNSLWDKIQTAHPAVRRENPARAYVKLEDITGIKKSLIIEALMKVEKLSEQEFLKRIKMLEMIRRHL